MIKLVIFDLDGTLLDTIGDLAASVNHILSQRGLPVHPTDDYRFMVGNGVSKLVERALPEHLRDAEYVAEAKRDFVEYYTQHHLDRFTKPYEGIVELVTKLEERGVKMVVVSNKFQAGVDHLVGRMLPNTSFEALLGQIDHRPIKPHPAMDLEALKVCGVDACEALHLGDSPEDMAAAKAAGVLPVGAAWGFRPVSSLIEKGAAKVVDSPLQLLDVIDSIP